jgi:glucosamine--fructose-6-phosphate aminotransferase (isomerizing)
MCGIIGYVGERNAVPILLEGLNRLEYRGYDSAGLALQKDNNISIIKRSGRIAELEKLPEVNAFDSQVGIAHTRWATHGEPTSKNAHPHTDLSGDIAVVHNGIIENYHAIKELLAKEDIKMVSDTDSEVLAHLIKKFYLGDLQKAVTMALSVVEGALGIAVLHKSENKIVAARRGSPLLIGVGEDEHFVASDASAILKHTNKVVYLEDDQVATVTKEGVEVSKLSGEKIDNEVHELKWSVDQIEKGGYKHFMLKEIFSQPEALLNTLRGRIKNNKVKLTVDVDIDVLKRIIIIACGTSWHASLIGKYVIEKIAKVPVEVDYASEFRYRDPIVDSRDLLIAISQSGETADTLAGIREAKHKGAKTLGIVNVVGSTITREVDSGIYLHAGPEIGVASTKAFTCQITSMVLFALLLRQLKGGALSGALLKELEILPQKIQTILEQSEHIKGIADEYKDAKDMLYLGRGMQFPAALEAALKLKEISYIHAEGYPAAEMKHGPIALIDENMPVVCLAPEDETFEKMISNMQEIKARKGKVIAVVTNADDKIKELAHTIIEVPKTIDILQPILTSIPLQLFAYHIADLKGLNVDKPRNLAKSVTVE